ncbi:DUF1015 domain-containing protein [Flavimarina sp. Hel_I_48]|uniref:DUF1015 domain-containing protein n=1 Tax=Flavimarina sp. Hel_I_48 TaxID=1392488 RepID=UPI0004DF5DEA|nr:DUF1015 domain-containing protein [Flavimarina sp. Hel_I_48]
MHIKPFKAIRPTRDKVSLIAARSYETYTKAEREARLDNNPYSFLHILNPGYKYHKEITGTARFELVRNRYQEFKEDGIFIEEEAPAYYIYKIVDRDEQEFVGLVAAASVADYANNVIKKHEDTIALREELFKNYLKIAGFNAEAVLLTHPDNNDLQNIYEQVMSARAEYEFTTTYRDTHYLWPVHDPTLLSKITLLFRNIDPVYIADGHHRSSSSYLLAEELKKENHQHTGSESYNFFMSYLLPESQLRIDGFTRMVMDLNGLDSEGFLIALDHYYKIENRNAEYYEPTKPHHFCMYLDGRFYSLKLRKGHRNFENALEALDAQILYTTILKPLLNIKDLRSDTRISYGKGNNDMIRVKEQVDSGTYAVGFSMPPATITQIKDIADADLKMPPKSTYIRPKLRSGVTIYEF